MNWKLLALFIGAFITSVNIMWQVTLSNKLISMEVFWTFFSVILFAYISAAIVLVFKFSQVKLEAIIVKQAEENMRIRDVSEVCIELAGAKPEKVENIIETIRNVSSWNYSNDQLKYLKELELKLENIVKDKKKEVK